MYAQAAILTVRVAAKGIVLAFIVGALVAGVRFFRIPVLRQIARAYIEVSRNTPLLVQLFFLYFGLPKLGVVLESETCAVVGLAFLGGSYMAEAIRAGLEGVAPIQMLISLSHVSKTYPNGHQALVDVSVAVDPGEVLAIIGPSGCGKSTLLRTVNGLEPVDSGQIVVNGREVTSGATNLKDVRSDVGMVFQSYDLFPHLTVMENLLLAPKVVQGADQAEARERALGLLERVGLRAKADARPRELSGGQKQRVAIVRALMMQPRALLLDEITASLDPEIVREVLDVVVGLARDGMTMLVVTHEMSFARAVADRVAFMDAGRIVEIAPPEDFFAAPTTERAQRFLNQLVF